MVYVPTQPKKGDLAYCRANYLGLILLVDEDDTINNDTTTVYRGIHLSAEKLGQPWQSTDPRVVGHIGKFVEKLETNSSCIK